jgi:threonine dehydratase
MSNITLDTIREAHARMGPHLHRTPVLHSTRLSELVGASIYFKCENFQKVGAFKARGACNAIFSLSDDAAQRGVVTHSSGNHGAALAWAARLRGIKATVVVPRNAPVPKLQAIAGYGATIVQCEATVASREGTVNQLIQQHGYELIHPYDDDRIIAGQGTAALELLEQQPNLDVVITPTGGGGLLSGTALAVKLSDASKLVYGAEPCGADDAYRSFTTGKLVTEQTPETVCDGLRTVLSERTFNIIRQHVDGIGTASEEKIIEAMRLTWSLVKIIVEPSCCPPLGAILEGTLPVKGKRVGIILTGGNVDLDKLPWTKG